MTRGEEIIFFPDSSGGFVAGLAVVLALLGLALAAALFRRRDQLGDRSVWFAPVFLLGLAGTLGYFVFTDAKAVVITSPAAIELRYVWPRPAVVIELADLADVRIEYRGTKRPSPRLVIETRRGEHYEGEGTNRPDRVQLAKRRLDELRGGRRVDDE